jgi:hypothetical protein
MPTRSARTHLIAWIAVLQLLLQPMAVAAGCMLVPAGNGGCCCSAVASEVEGPVSCCSGETSEAAGDEAFGQGCQCALVPEPLPGTPPCAPEVPRAPAPVTLRTSWNLVPPGLLIRDLARIAWGSAVPWSRPPERLVFAVFRL